MNSFASFVTIFLIFLIIIFALLKKIPIFDCFTKGAKEGLLSTFYIAPTVVGLLTAITMFSSSGAMDVLVNLLNPLAIKLNIPKELLPIMITKPLSGSGTLAVLSSIFEKFSPDSFIGKVASVIMGSTETTFYVLSVYLAKSKFKIGKNLLISAFLMNIFSYFFSLVIFKIIKP